MTRKLRRGGGAIGGPSGSAGWPGAQALIADAVQRYRAGSPAESEALCRRILAIDPRHIDALRLIGTIAAQTGRPGEAVAFFSQVCERGSGRPEDFSNLGTAYHDQGRIEEAIGYYRKAIAVGPNYGTAHYNLAKALADLGRWEDAEASYRAALHLQPDDPDACTNFGVVLERLGRLAEADTLHRRALTLRPNFPEALVNLGTASHKLGHYDEAIDCFRRALVMSPKMAAAHYNLGRSLGVVGRWEDAAVSFQNALAIRPDDGDVVVSLAVALRELGRLEEAVAFCRRAIALRPGDADAHTNLGCLLQDMRLLDPAAACHRKAIELAPSRPECHVNLGCVLHLQRRLDEAVDSNRRAIEIDPDNADAHHNLAVALLSLGQMAEGWQEYEWRWKIPQMIAAHRDFSVPRWNGEPASGKTLLLHAEQGFGDTLQFCRYASLAARLGMRVIVEAPPSLVRLLGGLKGIDQVVARGQALPRADLHCPMLSMPLAVGTVVETVPAEIPYLFSDPERTADWAQRLAPFRNLRVGLVWAGNPLAQHRNLTALRRGRSIPTTFLTPLAGMEGIDFFSLQKDGSAGPDGMILNDFMAEMGDFADTASLIANLDLVVSVDTAVAHLAAAMGKPVWVMNRFDACWRWLHERDDSPWYPTLRLFTQPAPGDWRSVVDRIGAELTLLVRRRVRG